ncbi:DddA-like double-stranded DNA deaminase toxin [Actinokineospora sp.]|uniref:DddA-like double-stranded DNA deaminase toxin n=1 Tax=Actinokineospora sp. TaxID=1872133 RepID=UPI0040383081
MSTKAIADDIEAVGLAMAELLGDHPLIHLIRDAIARADTLTDALTRLTDILNTTAQHHNPADTPARATRPLGSPLNPRAALPRPPHRDKTHGRWLGNDGNTVMLASGNKQQYFEAANERAREVGLTSGHAQAPLARHVEIQFACRMVAHGLTDEVIEINRPVCGTNDHDKEWTDTCDKRLEDFLPEGGRLTVLDGTSPNGRVYIGRKRR